MTGDSPWAGDAGRPTDRAPDNEQPVAGPWNTTLFRSDDVLASAVGFEVYSSGVSFVLAVRLRQEHRLMNDPHWDEGPGRLQLGVEFDDGTRAELHVPAVDGSPLLRVSGGQGGDRSMDTELWLHPIPPPGPMSFVIRCDSLRITETRTVIDATPLSEATGGIVVPWPWQPAGQPELQPESWFRA